MADTNNPPEMIYNAIPLSGSCELCLTPECGAKGYVRYEGTPIVVGRDCIERMAALLSEPVKQPRRTRQAVAA